METNNKPPNPNPKPLNLDADLPPGSTGSDTYAEMAKAAKKSSFTGRLSAAFHDMLENGRGTNRRESVAELPPQNAATADDLAMRRAKNVSLKRMIVPEGVIISGSMTSGSETEISGRVEGDVVVEGRLYLGPTALITGNVRATSCKIEGLVEGKMECSDEIDLSNSGRLSADAMAGKRISVAGQVLGNITTAGMLRLHASSKVEGDIQARQLIMEEGATFNGSCHMRTPLQRNQK